MDNVCNIIEWEETIVKTRSNVPSPKDIAKGLKDMMKLSSSCSLAGETECSNGSVLAGGVAGFILGGPVGAIIGLSGAGIATTKPVCSYGGDSSYCKQTGCRISKLKELVSVNYDEETTEKIVKLLDSSGWITIHSCGRVTFNV